MTPNEYLPQDHQTVFPVYNDKLNTFGENTLQSYNQAQGNVYGNMEGVMINSTSDGRDNDKDGSMYSYSKVSQAFREDSLNMRQLRD